MTPFRDAFSAYGGFRAVVRSRYLHVAILLTAISWNEWLTRPWWETVIQVLPNVLGFSIGAYAILLTVGDDRFRSLILSDIGSRKAPYVGVSATFAFFVVSQAAALLFAIVRKALDFELFAWIGVSYVASATSAIGYLLFLYALLLSVAAAIGIFEVTRWLNVFHTSKAKPKPPSDDCS
jgi:hypothetical protein